MNAVHKSYILVVSPKCRHQMERDVTMALTLRFDAQKRAINRPSLSDLAVYFRPTTPPSPLFSHAAPCRFWVTLLALDEFADSLFPGNINTLLRPG